MSRDVQVTFDCADPAALAEFWADALGYQVLSMTVDEAGR